jgi:lipoprotein-anchoring transpeptidase ErfK/SrfK
MSIRERISSIVISMGALATLVAGEMYLPTQVEGTHRHARSATGGSIIVINVQDRRLTVMRDGKPVAEYKIAVGKPETPTPTGHFRITNMRSYPGNTTNVFGVRWMQFHRVKSSNGGSFLYGIHGTNEPEKIGDAVTHGCIRLSNPDVEQVFAQAYIGEPVEIVDSPKP